MMVITYLPTLGNPHPVVFLQRTKKDALAPHDKELEDPSPNLKEDYSIVCARCETTITKSSYIFAFDNEQTTRVFANPAGALFEVVTVTDAENVKTLHNPSTEFTWFPGYSWQICFCAQCSSQIGWFFQNVESPQLIESFYAFILSAIKELH